MGGFVRDILTTLSYEPHPAEAAGVDGEALSRLDQRLAGFAQGSGRARTAISIRPSDCSVWDGNPRDVPGLSAESCRSLIESIAQEDGNRIPVLVRHNAPGADHPYQLLVGSRRRFSVDWLNHNGRPEIRLTALIVDLTDEEAFRLADIENREREDITELDRARSYQNAVDRFYGGVQSRMAEALNLSNSQLSRLLSLAQMPDEVVNAFATRDELRVRHSEVLTPLLRRAEQRERLLVSARLIGEEQQRLAAGGERMIPAATVLARLKDAAKEGDIRRGNDRPLVLGDARVGRIRAGREGLAVDLLVSEETDIDALLVTLRDALIDSRRLLSVEPEPAA
ncbi:ParB family chromosome partitioning protein [Novosphingobium sp. PhB57]|jgi:ParB family chromosome partitioning protein|uniref:ParB/RepB/Spo0J family partition protein n=1 Tax=unclassified Novosphingobium TaxID=2644732 RepID=UPI001043D1AF|nr:MULTISPECIES: ParB/RepB/Spo0J family partition protein [unclassified Novosphingobium]TCU57530.1 ParB family chromosome partitioning protein [Novosphingobium sp. PhB57]TDW67145.1 ParB family chromosome partitioning protein [Novosphingobium sp. PhB55]